MIVSKHKIFIVMLSMATIAFADMKPIAKTIFAQLTQDCNGLKPQVNRKKLSLALLQAYDKMIDNDTKEKHRNGPRNNSDAFVGAEYVMEEIEEREKSE